MELVIDRDKWRGIVRQAKSPKRAVAPTEEEHQNMTSTTFDRISICNRDGHNVGYIETVHNSQSPGCSHLSVNKEEITNTSTSPNILFSL